MEVLRRSCRPEPVGKAWQAAFADTDRLGRPCRSCSNPTARVQVGEAEGALTSLCTSCHLAWFDASAWELLPHRAPEPTRKKFGGAPVVAAAPQRDIGPESSLDMPLPPLPPGGARRNDRAVLRGHFEPLPTTNPTQFSYAAIPGVPASRGLITWGFIASLAIVGAVTLPLADAKDLLGFKPARPLAAAGLPLVSSFYVHATLGHLLVSLYFLAALGDRVEAMLGTRRYLSTIFAATIFGSLAYALGGPASVTPLVGAGSGISGLIVLYALSAPGARVSVLVFYDSPRVSVWLFLAIWILIQLVGDFALWGDGSPTPYSLQLAGGFVGIVAWIGVAFEAPTGPRPRGTVSRSRR